MILIQYSVLSALNSYNRCNQGEAEKICRSAKEGRSDFGARAYKEAGHRRDCASRTRFGRKSSVLLSSFPFLLSALFLLIVWQFSQSVLHIVTRDFLLENTVETPV